MYGWAQYIYRLYGLLYLGIEEFLLDLERPYDVCLLHRELGFELGYFDILFLRF